MKVQRLRVTFGRGEELKYITHLDLMRFWERALRRAQLPVAYSEGFSPHAQLSLAAPLPVGTTSEAELMDVFMEERTAPKTFLLEASNQLPPAMTISAVEEAGLALPALQADVRFAEYEVDVKVTLGATSEVDPPGPPDGHASDDGRWKMEDGRLKAEAGGGSPVAAVPTSNIQHPTSLAQRTSDEPQATAPTSNLQHLTSAPQAAIDAFMAAASVPWEHKRDEEVRSYDIRAQVERIEIIAGTADGTRLRMRLKNDNTGSGRPEQVTLALGLGTPVRIHRTKLVLAGTSPSREAWRKRGRFAS